MTDRFTISVNDNTADESPSLMQIFVQDGLVAADMDEIRNAVDALTIGVLGASNLVNVTAHQTGSGAKPSDPLAQKEIKLRVSFTDNVTTKRGSFTIPCGDLTQLSVNSEAVDITSGPGLALATAINDHGASDVGNAVTVTDIRYVG